MSPSIDVITLALTDPEATRRFYEDGLGCPPADESADAVSFHLGARASTLALRPWDALATDVTASPQSSGFRGFTMSYIVESAADVDAVLGRVAEGRRRGHQAAAVCGVGLQRLRDRPERTPVEDRLAPSAGR